MPTREVKEFQMQTPLVFGLTLPVLWVSLALRAPIQFCLAGLVGFTLGMESLVVICALLGQDMLSDGLAARSHPVKCGIMMLCANAGLALGGWLGYVLWGIAGLGVALLSAALFDRASTLDLKLAAPASLLALSFAMIIHFVVTLIVPNASIMVQNALMMVCAAAVFVLAARFYATKIINDDAEATTQHAPNDLPAPSRGFIACILVPLALLCCFFGISHNFAFDVAANSSLAQLLSYALSAVFLLVMLAWLFARDTDATWRHPFEAVFLFALIIGLALLFNDREGKTYLIALMLAGRPIAVALLWLVALAFVKRGTYKPLQAYPFAFGIAGIAGAAGLALALSGVLNGFLLAFPHEGIYLFCACAAVVLGYELALANDFLREGMPTPNLANTARNGSTGTAITKTPTLEQRCASFATERGLTEREGEIVRLLAAGRSRAYIAETLFLSENTVKWYCRQIYGKLDIHSKQELLTLLGVE